MPNKETITLVTLFNNKNFINVEQTRDTQKWGDRKRETERVTERERHRERQTERE
jgi:hypothetical protein